MSIKFFWVRVEKNNKNMYSTFRFNSRFYVILYYLRRVWYYFLMWDQKDKVHKSPNNYMKCLDKRSVNSGQCSCKHTVQQVVLAILIVLNVSTDFAHKKHCNVSLSVWIKVLRLFCNRRIITYNYYELILMQLHIYKQIIRL